MRKLLAGAAFAAIVTLAGQASANLLVNGSFETGDFTGWTQSGNLGYTSVTSGDYNGSPAEDGSYYVFEGPVGSDGFLSQTFTDTPGETLKITGWVIGDGAETSDVGFYFDSATLLYINPVPNQPWTEYTVYATATGSDTFSVGFRNDPSFDGLDNFSVTAAVPEASTWAMMVLGFAGLGFAGFRARRTAIAAL